MEEKKLIIKGIKKEMSQIFGESGAVIPVTRVVSEADLNVEILDKKVEVVGTSKGKGWAGVMKKWHFKGSMATGGQSDKPRAAGSIGAQTPGRVLRGKKMAGRLGNARVTVKGLKIVKVLPEAKELLISGPIPGSRNAKVSVKVYL